MSAPKLLQVAISAALALCVGCATLPFPEPSLNGPYGRSLASWTRKRTLYDGLETRAFVRMTWLSPSFVEVQASEVARMRAELPDEARRTLMHLREKTRGPTFFAVVHTPDTAWNDWNQKGSVWRVALGIGGSEVEPTQVERFERPFNAELRALYPFLDDYSVAYVIHFPAPPQAPSAGAQLTGGAVGQRGPAAAASGDSQADGYIPPAPMHVVAAGALGKMEFEWNPDGTEPRK